VVAQVASRSAWPTSCTLAGVLDGRLRPPHGRRRRRGVCTSPRPSSRRRRVVGSLVGSRLAAAFGAGLGETPA
jgi:hypothetical protein